MAGLHEAERLLLAHGKRRVWEHSQAVAGMAKSLAAGFALDAQALETAALCHDIGGCWPPERQLAEAIRRGMALDPAEERYPFLLHQRFSRILCGEVLGVADPRVLSAVGCHTTLRAQATPLDTALFVADKLAWDQAGTPPYDRPVRLALETSLEAAALAYIDFSMESGGFLMPHKWLLEAWDWLRRGDGGR